MACSKFFSGDLPELINEVMQHFHCDYRTLHSCILVNRLWCRLAIPLLWENPFSIKFPKNYRFIEIYLYNLNDEDKAKLNEYIIYNDLFPSNTLFNYSSFIQRLETHKIVNSIDIWVETVKTATTKVPNSDYFIRFRNLLSYSQMINFTKLIYKSLFRIFIENKVNLHSFEFRLLNNEDLKYFDEILELILQNPNFICNIKNFKLDFYMTNITNDNIIRFLSFLSSNCNSISSVHLLHLLFPSYYNNFSIIEKILSQLINSQKNLQKILLGYSDFPLYHLPLSLKNPNCSNKLKTIIFYYVDFKNVTVLNEVFNQLNVLESIHIICCYSLDSRFIQQIINITKPFKLKSLLLDEILHIEPLVLLIQKSGDYLENFGNEGGPQSLVQLFESTIKYCNKIKLLNLISGLNNENINLVFSLIENVKQNLNYLFLETYDIKISSIILQNLGQVLPDNLEYLSLYFDINNINDLEVFLKNSQNTFIKKLLIRNEMNEESEEIFPYIKEYIMKKKKVKYLAILGIFDKDLFFLKDKVEEFKLYDIQVLSYYDLFVDIYNLIKDD
ncbi:hypothetical protein RclHR1_01250016 [Rhizophagus clarus]|uniref:F-box domain-containing protein n=1 Tax=Rhizophagus clarus TaxID=94130 RepID=A0A2Z6Q7F0_9GLOM|nr:hypothetical protein RclHR1_01250016 [Rhizophagus clarus]GES79240.1 hypothetical protein GLOIN_2v1784886 [Rhizophagus clarus]